MNKWTLPASLKVGGADFEIRTDFRIVLGIFKWLKKDDLPEAARFSIVLKALYVDVDKIRQEDIDEALAKAFEFMAGGRDEVADDDTHKPQLVDWEKDADIIIPAINKVAGYDVRGQKLHWWTFLSMYSEIGEGTFATVVGIRNKMAHGKKLDDFEKEFLRENKAMVVIQTEETKRQMEEDRAALAEIGL